MTLVGITFCIALMLTAGWRIAQLDDGGDPSVVGVGWVFVFLGAIYGIGVFTGLAVH